MSYQWKVAALDYAVLQGGLSNVVTTVHWTCSSQDENGNSGYAYGSHGLPSPDPDNFVAWDSLDEFTVIGWCLADMTAQAGEGAEDPALAIQADVDAQIAEKANPTHGSGLPW